MILSRINRTMNKSIDRRKLTDATSLSSLLSATFLASDFGRAETCLCFRELAGRRSSSSSICCSSTTTTLAVPFCWPLSMLMSYGGYRNESAIVPLQGFRWLMQRLTPWLAISTHMDVSFGSQINLALLSSGSGLRFTIRTR